MDIRGTSAHASAYIPSDTSGCQPLVPVTLMPGRHVAIYCMALPIAISDGKRYDMPVPAWCQTLVEVNVVAREQPAAQQEHDEGEAPLPLALQQAVAHRITWSAWKRTDGGIVRRRALAAFRLITNSSFMGRSTGRSPVFAPLRILSTSRAAWRAMSASFAP